jgi:solute carrier family 50 protein (sugar transporter)
VVALFSAMLWIFYALIKSNETFLITINAAGCVIETIYIVMYFVYAPKKAKLFTAKIMLLLNVGVFGVILLLTLLLFKGGKRVVMLGWICVGFSVSVFVAPLSIMVSIALCGCMNGQIINPITVA